MSCFSRAVLVEVIASGGNGGTFQDQILAVEAPIL